MDKKICFIGHRNVYKYGEIEKRLYNLIEEKIIDGYKCFTMGTHGEFDKLALSVCRQLRNFYKFIKIEVVITSFKTIESKIEHDEIFGDEKFMPYNDVQTVMYEIEEVHFKKQIIVSNQQMIDTCEILICYVDTNRYVSGAKIAMKYALKKGLNIINLF